MSDTETVHNTADIDRVPKIIFVAEAIAEELGGGLGAGYGGAGFAGEDGVGGGPEVV